MTKIVRVKEEKKRGISRILVQRFGESVYRSEGVKSIIINIRFQDGSNIGFKRDEGEDDCECFFEDDE